MVEPVQRIGDYPFDISYMCFDESRYDEFLNTKHNEMRGRFQTLYTTVGLKESSVPVIDLIASPPRNCRQKCRFAIRRKRELGIVDGVGPEDGLVHAMWDEGKPTVLVEAFPIASVQIYNTMPILLEIIQSKPEYESLVRGFASVHYLSTLSGSLLITMNYNSNESEAFADESDGAKCAWRVAAESLYEELLARHIPSVQSLSLLGRTRGIKIVIGHDYVYETLHLSDGRSLQYKQVEEGFSNPNSVVNQRALQWLCDVAQQAAVPTGDNAHTGETGGVGAANAERSKIDLLEMYCGNGNHTVALAGEHLLLSSFYF
jgi:tRNA (uracil-5-)-methyltransferase